MPIPIEEALDQVSTDAEAKAQLLSSPVRYALQAMLAGAYVGIAVVLLASTAGPLAAASSPATKLVQGLVFGIALTLVVFAGADLFTGNNMSMFVGWLRGGVSIGQAVVVNVATLAGNFAGSVLFAGMVHASGVLDVAKPGGKPAGDGLILAAVTGKLHATDGQLFWRAVLCNMLVCVGLWMATRTRSDGAKLAVLFWVLLAFVASGFEHSVANMTIFALAIFHGDASWPDLFHNLLFTVPGNVLGGALIVGLPYALTASRRAAAVERRAPSPVAAESREPAGALGTA